MSYYNLNRLRHFVEVVQSGSFTAAAEKLGLGKAIVSHQVAKLEEELGASLLARTTRSLHLTSAGESFYEQAATILDLANNAALEVQQEQELPSGRLVVTAPDDYGRHVVARVLMQLRQIYPQLLVDALFTDEQLDPIRERIDVSIRVGWLKDSSRVARKIGEFQQHVVASPDYLARMGKVTSPQDLLDKDWIHNRKLSPLLEWMHEQTDEAHAFSLSDPKVTVTNTATAQLCAQQGGGLCVLPSYQIQEDLRLGRLEIVLPDWTLPSGGIFIVYPNMNFRPARTKIFVQELIRQQKLLA